MEFDIICDQCSTVNADFWIPLLITIVSNEAQSVFLFNNKAMLTALYAQANMLATSVDGYWTHRTGFEFGQRCVRFSDKEKGNPRPGKDA